MPVISACANSKKCCIYAEGLNNCEIDNNNKINQKSKTPFVFNPSSSLTSNRWFWVSCLFVYNMIIGNGICSAYLVFGRACQATLLKPPPCWTSALWNRCSFSLHDVTLIFCSVIFFFKTSIVLASFPLFLMFNIQIRAHLRKKLTS